MPCGLCYPYCMMLARDKILRLDELASMVSEAKSSNKVVALCHGCFDILHKGHIRHFESASALSDLLVVTVTQDKHINKGPNRPVFPELQRAEVLAGLNVIDWVAINRWDSAIQTIKIIRPSLFIKGEEYESRAEQINPNFIAEAEAVKDIGGQIAFTRDKFTSSSTMAFKRLSKDH